MTSSEWTPREGAAQEVAVTHALQATNPSRRNRIIAALLIGAACGFRSWCETRRPQFIAQDFQVFWLAAKAIHEGRNPYTSILFRDGPAFFYPLSAALFFVPLASLPATIAGPLFIGLSCALLAFSLTRAAWWPLLMFTSSSMLLCVRGAQFSALLTLGFVVPSAMWLGSLKPNLGLAMLAYRPSVKAALIMLLVASVAFIWMPSWPLEWLKAVRRSSFHYAPILTPIGPVLLLALTRWRRPEARLLTALSVLPSSPHLYELLPLFVIPKTWRQMALLSASTAIPYILQVLLSRDGELGPYIARGRWFVVLFGYLPALLLILRRPNVGDDS